MASIRLICPSCGATYEIDASAIPEQGRDVQCSNCSHVWFAEQDQPVARAAAIDTAPDGQGDVTGDLVLPEDAPGPVEETAGPATADSEPDPEESSGATPPTVAAPRRTLDSSIAEILREEAAREEAARRAEVEGQDAFKTQGDLTLDPPPPPARPKPVERTGPPGGSEPPARPDPAARPDLRRAQTEAPGPRTDVFPDIEEINSSFDRPRGLDFATDDEDSAGGTRAGFFTMLALIALAVLVYATAPRIAEAVPALADPMTGYVEAVDVGRIWLDVQVRALADIVGAG